MCMHNTLRCVNRVLDFCRAESLRNYPALTIDLLVYLGVAEARHYCTKLREQLGKPVARFAGTAGGEVSKTCRRPIGRWRIRSAADPGVGRATCGAPLAGLRLRSPRGRARCPAKIGEVRAVWRRCWCAASRAKPCERCPLAEAHHWLPRAAWASAPPAPASRKTSESGANATTMAIVDLATGFSAATGGLGDGFSGRSSGPGDGFFEGLRQWSWRRLWLALAVSAAARPWQRRAPNIYVSNNM